MNAGRLVTGILAFFLVCSLFTGQCMSERQEHFDSWAVAFTAYNPGEVRVYPKHTDFPSYPDHAELAKYVWKRYSDGTEYCLWQNSPHTGHAWSLFSSEGQFLIADEVGDGPWDTVTIDSGSYSIWRQAGGPSYPNYIEHLQRKAAVQWDLTGLPVGATVLGSTLHTQTHGHFGGYTNSFYVAFGAMFGSAVLPGNAVQDTLYYHDVAAGTSWVGGSQPWVMLECDILDERWPLVNLTTPPGSPWGAKDCFFYLSLGWGHRSEGKCTYVDIQYTLPAVVGGLEPDVVSREWTIVDISGSGFTADTVLECSDEFEIGETLYVSGTSMEVSVRKVGE